jgi:hypothetical protein
VGIADCYKVGHWTPVRVEIAGRQSLRDPRVEVIVEDSDGVATRAAAKVRSPAADAPSQPTLVYTKVGRVGAPIRIRLVDRETVVDELLIENKPSPPTSKTISLPATGELLVALSSAAFGLTEAIPDRGDGESQFGRRSRHLTSVADLPTDWFGYDAVDVMVINAGDGTIVSELAADEARYDALVRWVELGGKLVVLAGGDAAQKSLGEGGPLSAMVPGKLDRMVRLTETASLENFAEPAGPITMTGRNAALEIPRLENVEGRIVAYAGRRPSDLPIVVRSARGFGEITFAAVDSASRPLADWSDRSRFLQELVEPYIAALQEDDASQAIMTIGYNDLSGALRQRLGRSFPGIVPLGFSLVAALAVAYLLVLGPIDYFLVQRWLRQPMAGWITLPIVVLVFGFSALAIGQWRAGAGAVRVNLLQLVDIDATTGNARGTLWATLYSADARQFSLTAQAGIPGGQSASPPQILLSWWGLPGVGIGGMKAGGATLGVVDQTYEYSAGYDSLIGVPILPSATKSLVATWTATAHETLTSDLADVDGYATGSIENRTGQTLRNARLLYGGWGYRLGTVAAGQQIDVGEHLDARRVKTIAAGSALSASGTLTDAERSIFMPDEASAMQLLNLMMFYEAAGGSDFARLPNAVAAQVDLSRQVELNRAILVAEADGPAGGLVDSTSGEPIAGDNDDSKLVLRWVLRIQQNEND